VDITVNFLYNERMLTCPNGINSAEYQHADLSLLHRCSKGEMLRGVVEYCCTSLNWCHGHGGGSFDE
jgi:hypothetical protein